MATVSLKATSRSQTGKGVARKLRRSGVIPAVVYRAGEPATSVSVNPNELEVSFRRTNNPNTLVSVDIEGDSRLCLVKDVQRHPVSGQIQHLDFYEVTDDQFITVTVPIKAVGKAAGIQMGGKLQVIRRKLDVRSKPADIPAFVEVDVTELNIGEFIRASAISAPANTELVLPQDFNVITVVGKPVEVGEGEGEGELAADEG